MNQEHKDIIRGAARQLAMDLAEELEPIYKMLEWKWTKNGERYTPSAIDIQKIFFRLIDNVLDHGSLGSDTGGLFVEWEINEEGEKTSLCLSFKRSVDVYPDEVL